MVVGVNNPLLSPVNQNWQPHADYLYAPHTTAGFTKLSSGMAAPLAFDLLPNHLVLFQHAFKQDLPFHASLLHDP